MRYLGIDLAWSDTVAANATGVIALEQDGLVVAAGWAVGVAETVAWVNANAAADTSVFIDAPLVVLNPDGQRLCEKQVGERYGRWKVSANSTNRASRRLAGVAIREQLEASGWTYDDGSNGPSARGRMISECYPYTTLVGARELAYDVERPLYKRKPRKYSASEWRPIRAASCDELVRRLAALDRASPPLDLQSHPATKKLLTEPSPLDDRAYKHREDLIDACLAAWSAALWRTSGSSRCQVLGVEESLVAERGLRATIIAPARANRRGREPSLR